MKLFKSLIFGLCLLVVPCFAQNPQQQNSTGTISATTSNCNATLINTTSCIVLPLAKDSASATFAISGSYTGTLNFEVTVNGVTSSLSVTPQAGGAAVISTTGTGTWQVGVVASSTVQVRASALSGGTPSVTIQSSTAPLPSGGGSGTVTSVSGTANQIDIATGTTTPVVSIDSALQLPGTLSSAQAGAASTPAATFTGAPFTGGTGTTTVPLFYLNSGVAPTSWSTSGTVFGITDPVGFSGNALDIHSSGGGSLMSLSSAGAITTFGGYNAGGVISTSGNIAFATLTSTGQNSNGFCRANGTAANPSVASCSTAAAGMFSCATNASGGTCQVNTTRITASSTVLITQDAADGGASQLNVTCNTASDLPTTTPILESKSAGVSFTINVGTISTNPACFEFLIVN